MKFVKQQNEKDCAVACLYNIIRYHKGYVDMDKLRVKLKTNKDGTSVYDIVKVSNEIGFQSDAYECELNNLIDVKLPIIAHIKLNNIYDHFVIVYKIVDYDVYIFDPIRGYIKLQMEEFENTWTGIIITFNKINNILKEKNKFISILYSDIKKYYKIIFLVLFLSLLSTILSIIHSLYLSYLFDSKFNYSNVFILFLIICVLKIVLDYIRNNLILTLNIKFDSSLTNKTFKNILSLPLLYHHNRPVGDIVSRINDLSSIKEFINNISFSFIIDFAYIFIINIILLSINKLMFLITLIMEFLYMLIYLLCRRNLDKLSYVVKNNASISNSYLVESILGIDTIKNFSIEDKRNTEFKKVYKKFLLSSKKISKLVFNYSLFQELVCNLSSILCIYIGFILLYKNSLSLSKLICFNSLVISLFISFKNIISLDQLVIDAKNSYKRIIELNKVKGHKHYRKINQVNTIRFNNVSYSYNGVYNIINNINFAIKKGEYVFVKGSSGSGKSTIFKLLMKILECDNNMIKINDIDVNNISYSDITNNICFVSQNEYIFTDSILNNIRLFKEVSDEDIQKVIRITNIDNILKKRNITLDFLLEENGHNLSGGERQRIILARALLQNKEVLILDETMNELDIESERKIIQKIKTEYNLTLILISHRFSNNDLFEKVVQV